MRRGLFIVPGEILALFLVCTEGATQVIAMPPPAFAEGLKAATDLLSFSPPQRHDPSPEDLFPWTGNV